LDLKAIKELIALMKRNDLSEFKLEQENFKITLKRGIDFQPVYSTTGQPLPLPPPGYPHYSGPSAGTTSSQDPIPAGSKDETLRDVTSPMVGTFYSAASPESPPFVTIGQEVTEDSVVCIIEAMKVMNQIKAEIRGTIVEIVAENGKPVQFGQVLYRVR
jgi:acetyl-CoA carboxylase biotin carboxyl carrier protein